ncbi:MAG TPA: isoprenylcysteine carboxylmethyltransferase family protein [Balneolaceae bacterium]
MRIISIRFEKEGFMQKYFAVLTIILLFGMVLTRSLMMKRQGIKAVYFGKEDKKDFFIPPFALFYFYLIFANTFNLPAVNEQEFFRSEVASWIGVFVCLWGLLLFLLSLISFGKSFRVGIDTHKPDKLVTTGIFAFSRNPIYVAFAIILAGQFLIFPDWIFLVYLVAGIFLFHRQVLREEEFMKKQYGRKYLQYCNQVRRYL